MAGNPNPRLHFSSLSHFLNAVAGKERRPRRCRNVLYSRWLPPPPISEVALASATGVMVYPRPRRRRSSPLLPALVRRVPLGYSLRCFNALHARCSPLRSHLRSICHRRPRPRLAPVTTIRSAARIIIFFFFFKTTFMN